MTTAETGKTPETRNNVIGPLADFWIVSAGKLLEPIAHSIERVIALTGIKPTIEGERAEDAAVNQIITSIMNDSPSGVEDPINPLAQIDYQLKIAVFDQIYGDDTLYEGLTARRMNNSVDIARVMVFRVWDKLVLQLPEILEIMEVPEKTIIESRGRFFSVLDNMFDWVLMRKEYWKRK